MKRSQLEQLLLVALVSLIIQGCASTSTSTPVLQTHQYQLEEEAQSTIAKSDVEISVTPIVLNDWYDYPELFAFSLSDFPQFENNYYIRNNLPVGPLGKRWCYPLNAQDILMCQVTVQNNTDHILRMADARIYLTMGGHEPIPALSEFDQLIREAEKEEARERQKWEAQILKLGEFPVGISRAFLNSRRDEYRLINNLDREILPGYGLGGLLVFSGIGYPSGPASISFFDVTTKTDAAGNATEKTKFDFHLESRLIEMWYNNTARKWEEGTPPPLHP